MAEGGRQREKRVKSVGTGVTTLLNMGPKQEKEHSEDGSGLRILKEHRTNRDGVGMEI